MTQFAVCASGVRFAPSHFTGKEHDVESGNDYFEARYYASTMGRFLTPDWSAKEEPVPYAKMDDPQSLNLYAYVADNPLGRNDPDGHGEIGDMIPIHRWSTPVSFLGFEMQVESMELTYDRTGDVSAEAAAGNAYLYDAEGQVCATMNLLVGTMTGYIYDAEGTRVAKGTISAWTCDIKSNGFQPVSDYIIGPGGEQLTETGSDGQGNMVWSHTNVFAAGSLIGTYDKDGLHFYLNDWLGNRRVQTDYAGVFEQSCTNLPFGDSLNCTASLVSPTEHHFTGKERDVESGNDYFEARYYASSMGRFMTPDWSAKIMPVPYAKLGNPQSLNLYCYVYNNPLSNVDPDGHLGCGFLWLGNCSTGPLAPPPAPPNPPALADPESHPGQLAGAQEAARNNPANAPTGERGTPERTTHCNQATCQIATATNAPTGALLDPKTGLPNLANTDAKTLANSPDWGKVDPQTAQDLATLGVTVLGVRPEDPHGHIVTVAPEMLPGDQNVQKYGPLINNIGGSIGVTNANNVFRGTPATYYAPTTPQW